MNKTLFVVRSNPTEGREADFNAWYTDVHLPEVLNIPGFLNAQRFFLNDFQVQDQPFEYLAIYEMDTNNVAATLEAIGTAGLTASDAIDNATIHAAVFDAVTDLMLPV